MIKIIKYKGFKTIFIIPKEIEKYLISKDVDIPKIIPDSFTWYEVILFDIIDENQDGIPDKKFGRNFKVIFYKVIKEWKNGKEKILTTKIKYDNKKSLGESMQEIRKGKMGIRYILLMQD